MVKGIRERISSSVNLYLSKANIYKEKDILLVEYINRTFIKENNSYFYIVHSTSQKEKVEDDDMEWLVDIFIERLDERLRRSTTEKKQVETVAKVIDLIEYKNARVGEENE
ncbi:MAG: hypothetical protein RR620_08365 [Clostridium sp.]